MLAVVFGEEADGLLALVEHGKQAAEDFFTLMGEGGHTRIVDDLIRLKCLECLNADPVGKVGVNVFVAGV